MDGLTRPFKEIPPKHFYDTEGSRLFEQIMGLPEYYPTRTERSILEANAAALVEATRAAELVELGSGVPTKTLLLLDAMRDAGTLDRYVPFDVSEVVLLRERRSCSSSATRASASTASWATSSATSTRCREPEGPRVIVFLGGTIGNFLPGTRRRFLRSLAGSAAPAGPAPARHRPRQGPGGARGAPTTTRRASRRRSTATCSPSSTASSTPTSTSTPSSTSRSTTASRSGSRCACARCGRWTSTSRKLGLDVHFANREELRTEISAKFTRARLEADLRAAGLRAG